MIYHVSIAADAPCRVATTLAELWGGVATPFPPVAGGWVAHADDERCSMIEVFPNGVEIVETPGDADASGRINPAPSRTTATHIAIATPLSEPHVLAIAAREGWSAKYRKRGGAARHDGRGFGVIEFWVENRLMIEVLTAEMQAQYHGTCTLHALQDLLAEHGLSRAA